MLIDKKKIKNKLLSRYNNYCNICNKEVSSDEIINGEFEYVKSKITGEKIYHKNCLINEIEKFKFSFERRINI